MTSNNYLNIIATLFVATTSIFLFTIINKKIDQFTNVNPSPYTQPTNNPNPGLDQNRNSDMIPDMSINSDLQVQPLLYKYQIYPRTPWYPKLNIACGSGCGATSMCNSEGKCERRPITGTVFDGEVHYKFKTKKNN